MHSKDKLASLLLLVLAVKSSAVDSQRMISTSTRTLRKRQRRHKQQQAEPEVKFSFDTSWYSHDKGPKEQNQGRNDEYTLIDLDNYDDENEQSQEPVTPTDNDITSQADGQNEQNQGSNNESTQTGNNGNENLQNQGTSNEEIILVYNTSDANEQGSNNESSPLDDVKDGNNPSMIQPPDEHNQGNNTESAQENNNGNDANDPSIGGGFLSSYGPGTEGTCDLPSCDAATNFKGGSNSDTIFVKFAYEIETDPTIVNGPVTERIIPNLECAIETVVRESLSGKCKNGCPRRLDESIEITPRRKLEVVSVSPCPLDKKTSDVTCQQPKAKEGNACNDVQGGMTITAIGENKEILENQVIYAVQSAMYRDELIRAADGIVRVSYVRTTFWGSAPQEQGEDFIIGVPKRKKPAKGPDRSNDRDIPEVQSTTKTGLSSIWIIGAIVIFVGACSICTLAFGRKKDADNDIDSDVDSSLLDESSAEVL